MAGPSNHGARGAHLADDQHAGSAPDESNSQVALPMLSLDQSLVLADPLVEPLQSFDPEFDALLAAIACVPDPAPIVTGDGNQVPIIGHNDQVPIVGGRDQAVHDDIAVVPEATMLSNGGPMPYSDYPARNTRRRARDHHAAPPAPYYARGGRRGRRRARGSPGAHRDPIETERNRRREMNDLFASLRQMLPTTEARMDRSAIVLAAINHITALELELTSLLQESLASTTHFQAQDLVSVDHSTVHTTITTPAIADPSTLSSIVSANVTLSVICQTSFITVSSRHGADHMRLYARVLAVLHAHHLDVEAGTVSAQNNYTVGYTFQCQANAGAEMMSGELHAALQDAVNGYNHRV